MHFKQIDCLRLPTFYVLTLATSKLVTGAKFKKQLLASLLVTGLTIVASSQANAVDLQVNSAGILTGAKNVVVGSFLYDVQFVDGTANSLFQGSLTFATFAAAKAASQALLDQVFVDVPQGYQFDSVPNLVFGCKQTDPCGTLTPYTFNYDSLGNPLDIGASIADNYANYPNYQPDMLLYTTSFLASYDTSNDNRLNYAVWSVASVPEPDSYAMALMGLGLMGFVARRRKADKSI